MFDGYTGNNRHFLSVLASCMYVVGYYESNISFAPSLLVDDLSAK